MKKRFLLLIALIGSLSMNAQEWTYHWANEISSTEDDDESNLIAVDENDNVFVVSQYSGALSINGVAYPDPADDGRDIIVVKYDGDGNVLWSDNIFGEGGATTVGKFDLVQAITTDASGNLYIVGNMGPNATYFGETSSYPEDRNFVMKISGDGDFLWTVEANADYLNDYFTAICIANDGSIYVAGNGGPDGTENYGIGGQPLSSGETSVQNNQAILFKLDSDGNLLYSETMTGPPPSQIALDSEENLVFSSRVSGGTSGNYVVKYDGASRDELWTRVVEHNNFDNQTRSMGLYVKEDDSILHFLKINSDELDFGNGISVDSDFNQFGILWELTPDGETSSAQFVSDLFEVTQVGFDFVYEVYGFHMIDENSFYLAGLLYDGTTLTDGTVLTSSPGNFPNFGSEDALLMELDTDFNVLGLAYQTGGGRQRGTGVASFSNGDAALTGFFNQFNGTTDFGSTQLTGVNNSRHQFITRATPGFPSPDGLEEQSERFGFNQFPNPTSDFLNITFENRLSDQAFVEIIDISGRSVIQKNFTAQGMVNLSLDLQELQSGFYLTRVQIGSDSFGGRFVLAK